MWDINDVLSFEKDGAMPRKAHAEPGTQPTDRPLQRHPRTLFSAPLKLQYLGTGGVRTTHGISLDISESGIGALLQHTLQVGETVGLEFQLEGSPLRAVAIVRHSSSLRSGFEFVGLTLEERALLAGVVASA